MIGELKKILSKLGTDQEFTLCNELVTPDAPAVRLVHQDHRLINLDKFLDQPRVLHDAIDLYQLDSFTNYINEFKPKPDADTKYGQAAIFVSLDREVLKVICKLQYHKSYDQPTHDGHYLELICRLDDSFHIWSDCDNTWMSQKRMVDLLKKHSQSIGGDGFAKLLESIEDVKGNTDFKSEQKAAISGSSSVTYFNTLQEFTFSFRPYCSLPFKYSIKADFTVQIDDGEVKFKYSIRNPISIYEQVANDLRDEFNKLENVLVF